MSKFKVGDEVIFVEYDQERDDEKEKGFNVGHVYKISRISDLHVRIENEEGFIYVDNFQIKPSGGYQASNRNKLREHIKSLGFTAIDLSMAAGFSKYYFGSETSESRFNKRGDISDKRLSKLKALASSAKDKLSINLWSKINNELADFGGVKEEELTIVINNYQPPVYAVKPNSTETKELIKKSLDKRNTKPEKIKSKWIVSNKVFFTFVFIVSLLILFIATGVVKQVF